MKIKWANGYHSKVAAEVAHESLESIRSEYGGELKPERVVDAARATSHPLHPAFEWRDEVAAEQFRRQQAGSMIRCLVSIKEGTNEQGPRVYHNVKIERQSGHEQLSVFKTIDDILADPEARQQLLRRARAELASFRKKYKDLQELASLFKAMDELVTQD